MIWQVIQEVAKMIKILKSLVEKIQMATKKMESHHTGTTCCKRLKVLTLVTVLMQLVSKVLDYVSVRNLQYCTGINTQILN